MRAAVYFGRDDVRLVDRPAPAPPARGWLTVAVSYCGICGTDIEEITEGPAIVPTEPHPLTGASLPITLGHEGTGSVTAVGAGVKLAPGDRVAIEGTMTCGDCTWCRQGLTQLCPQIAGIGFMLDGALAEAVNVPAAMCAVMPPTMPDEAGALAEPLSVAVRAERRSGGVDGRTVQVIGAGTVGLLAAQVARARGAKWVVLRDPAEGRRATAASLSLEAVSPGDEVPPADVVFECSGSASGLESALTNTQRGGATVVVGIHVEPRPIDLLGMLLQERQLTTSLAHTFQEDFIPAVAMLAEGVVQFEPLVSDRVRLSRVIEDGFDPLRSEPARHGKILVDCRS